MTIVVYITSIPSTLAIRKSQDRITTILAAKKLEHVCIDISTNQQAKEFMYQHSKSKQLPQIFVDDVYKGMLQDVEEQNEIGSLVEWLGQGQ
jgi:glutaredoxin